MSELEKAAVELEEEQLEEDDEQFFIADNDMKAEYYLKMIREKTEEKERWKEHYEKLYAKVAMECDRLIEMANVRLESFLRQQMEDGYAKKTKTQVNYLLPSGKLVLKHQQPEYKVDDETLVPWLEANNPELVKVKKTADWAGLKKSVTYYEGQVVTEDGEIVPGVTATERPDVFKVEVK